jgi:drug/metabolite transporter (DMT)-like permease
VGGPDLHDGILLLVLAGFCTLLPFALALVALRHLSAYTVQLVTNLEPVYAVVLAVRCCASSTKSPRGSTSAWRSS